MKRGFRLSVFGSRLKFSLLFTSCCLLATGLCGCKNQRLYKDNRIMMGTFIEVVSPDKQAAKIIFSEISRIENLLSKYKPDSEIARLNRLGEIKASPDTFYVLKKSKEFSQVTDGAFDVTCGVLIDLWGFTDKKYARPSQAQIKQALVLAGSDKIILNETNNVVKLKLPGMKLDLGGIAKGFALDCAVEKLKQNNINSCLINAGGQVYCLGDKFGRPWRVVINKAAKGYLELKDQSVSTSGGYEQYFIKDNKRYSHILNPKTGYPADSGITSATVIARDGLTADALSTAVFVLGKEKGRDLLKKFPEVQIRIIEE